MHLKPQVGIKVVKKEEKEAQLKAFIKADLDQRAKNSKKGPNTVLVVARSLESPVILALTSLASELVNAGVTTKIILSGIDVPSTGVVSETQMGASCAEVILAQTRIAHDPRLFDAHEQLVLSKNRVWVGDIMRREPAKRDAFENYSKTCKTTARWTKMAFKRLWAASKDSPAVSLTDGTSAVLSEKFSPLAVAAGDATDQGATAGTRH